MMITTATVIRTFSIAFPLVGEVLLNFGISASTSSRQEVFPGLLRLPC